MGATALILLILFLIGIGVLLYYVMVCFQSRPKTTKSHHTHPDLGPLLAHDSDFNGNHEDVPVQPVRYIDQPDSSKGNDEPEVVDYPNKEKELEKPLKSVTFHTTPECASKNPTKDDSVFLPIDEPPLNSSKLLVTPHQDRSPHIGNETVNYPSSKELHYIPIMQPVISNHPSKTLSDSYEEDGLLVPRRTPPPNRIVTLPIVLPILQKEPEYIHRMSAPSSIHQTPHENYPSKHVRFISPYTNPPCIVETVPVHTEKLQETVSKDSSYGVNVINIQNEAATPNKRKNLENSGSMHPIEYQNESDNISEGKQVLVKPSANNLSNIYSHQAPICIPPASVVLSLETKTPGAAPTEKSLSKLPEQLNTQDTLDISKDVKKSADNSTARDYAANASVFESPVVGWSIPCPNKPVQIHDERTLLNPELLEDCISLPESTVSRHEEETISPLENEVFESTPSTVVKVLFPTEDNESASVTPSSNEPVSSQDESDSETSSDPDITEYNFQSGHLVPTTAIVLANEVSFYSDPKIGLTSFTSLSDSPTPNIPTSTPDEGQPLTPTSESNQSTSPGSSHDTSLDEETSHPLNKPQIVYPGTPPMTPPERENSPKFLIGNPSSEKSETAPTFIVLETHNNRKRSTSSSSSSSSSSNGSYKIQIIKEENTGESPVFSDGSKITRLKK